jgi:4-hydroxy-tetrahydrodipicolinate reductase
MGAAVCTAVGADPALELVAAVDPAHAGSKVGTGALVVVAEPAAMAEAGVEVAVDFTVPAAVMANAAWCAAHGVHAVIGTTGLDAAALAEMGRLFEQSKANCVVAPNFALGAVLMMRFAELAAPWFETVEVVELHHDAKLDAPSGTAQMTALRMAAARAAAGKGPTGESLPVAAPEARGQEAAPGVRVHSVRLRGLVAHQEVLLGTTGQVLTIRHDSLDRSSFMSGVLLAVREVPRRRGFTVGLDKLLGI